MKNKCLSKEFNNNNLNNKKTNSTSKNKYSLNDYSYIKMNTNNQFINAAYFLPNIHYDKNCIVIKYGYKKSLQTFYKCYTCDPEGKLPFCNICKEKCHNQIYNKDTDILENISDYSNNNKKNIKHEIKAEYIESICYCGISNHNIKTYLGQNDNTKKSSCFLGIWNKINYKPLENNLCSYCNLVCKHNTKDKTFKSDKNEYIDNNYNNIIYNNSCSDDEINEIYDSYNTLTNNEFKFKDNINYKDIEKFNDKLENFKCICNSTYYHSDAISTEILNLIKIDNIMNNNNYNNIFKCNKTQLLNMILFNSKIVNQIYGDLFEYKLHDLYMFKHYNSINLTDSNMKYLQNLTTINNSLVKNVAISNISSVNKETLELLQRFVNLVFYDSLKSNLKIEAEYNNLYITNIESDLLQYSTNNIISDCFSFDFLFHALRNNFDVKNSYIWNSNKQILLIYVNFVMQNDLKHYIYLNRSAKLNNVNLNNNIRISAYNEYFNLKDMLNLNMFVRMGLTGLVEKIYYKVKSKFNSNNENSNILNNNQNNLLDNIDYNSKIYSIYNYCKCFINLLEFYININNNSNSLYSLEIIAILYSVLAKLSCYLLYNNEQTRKVINLTNLLIQQYLYFKENNYTSHLVLTNIKNIAKEYNIKESNKYTMEQRKQLFSILNNYSFILTNTIFQYNDEVILNLFNKTNKSDSYVDFIHFTDLGILIYKSVILCEELLIYLPNNFKLNSDVINSVDYSYNYSLYLYENQETDEIIAKEQFKNILDICLNLKDDIYMLSIDSLLSSNNILNYFDVIVLNNLNEKEILLKQKIFNLEIELENNYNSFFSWNSANLEKIENCVFNCYSKFSAFLNEINCECSVEAIWKKMNNFNNIINEIEIHNISEYSYEKKYRAFINYKYSNDIFNTVKHQLNTIDYKTKNKKTSKQEILNLLYNITGIQKVNSTNSNNNIIESLSLFRIQVLLANSCFLETLLKSIKILKSLHDYRFRIEFNDNETHDYFKMKDHVFNSLLKILYYFTHNSPQNCIIILSKTYIKAYLCASKNQSLRFLELVYTALKTISISNYVVNNFYYLIVYLKNIIYENTYSEFDYEKTLLIILILQKMLSIKVFEKDKEYYNIKFLLKDLYTGNKSTFVNIFNSYKKFDIYNNEINASNLFDINEVNNKNKDSYFSKNYVNNITSYRELQSGCISSKENNNKIKFCTNSNNNSNIDLVNIKQDKKKYKLTSFKNPILGKDISNKTINNNFSRNNKNVVKKQAKDVAFNNKEIIPDWNHSTIIGYNNLNNITYSQFLNLNLKNLIRIKDSETAEDCLFKYNILFTSLFSLFNCIYERNYLAKLQDYDFVNNEFLCVKDCMIVLKSKDIDLCLRTQILKYIKIQQIDYEIVYSNYINYKSSIICNLSNNDNFLQSYINNYVNIKHTIDNNSNVKLIDQIDLKQKIHNFNFYNSILNLNNFRSKIDNNDNNSLRKKDEFTNNLITKLRISYFVLKHELKHIIKYEFSKISSEILDLKITNSKYKNCSSTIQFKKLHFYLINGIIPMLDSYNEMNIGILRHMSGIKFLEYYELYTQLLKIKAYYLNILENIVLYVNNTTTTTNNIKINDFEYLPDITIKDIEYEKHILLTDLNVCNEDTINNFDFIAVYFLLNKHLKFFINIYITTNKININNNLNKENFNLLFNTYKKKNLEKETFDKTKILLNNNLCYFEYLQSKKIINIQKEAENIIKYLNKTDNKLLLNIDNFNNNELDLLDTNTLFKNINSITLNILNLYTYQKELLPDKNCLNKILNSKYINTKNNYLDILIKIMFNKLDNQFLNIDYYWNIFNLLQINTTLSQDSIKAELLENKGFYKINIMLNVLIINLMSILFSKKSNILICLNKDLDYLICFNIIKVFKYLCEEHNPEFQEIFFSKLNVDYLHISNKDNNNCTPLANTDILQKTINTLNNYNENLLGNYYDNSNITNKSISFYDFLLCILSKIILISEWDNYLNKLKYKLCNYSSSLIDINHKLDFINQNVYANYYYDLFYCICELCIEMVQGTSAKNFKQFLDNPHSGIILDKFISDIKVLLLSKSYYTIEYNKVLVEMQLNLINIVLSFVEEKNTPPEIIILIANKISPIDVLETLNIIIISLYNDIKHNDTNDSKNYIKINNSVNFALYDYTENNNLFTLDKKEFLTKMYFSDINFLDEYSTMNLANKMFQYLTLLAEEYKIDQAKDLIYESLNNKNSKYYNLISFFSKINKIIEVKFEENIRSIIYTVHPLTNYLSLNTKKEFENNVDRSNYYTKLYSLIVNSQFFFEEVKYNYDNSKKSYFYSVLKDYNYKIVEYISFILLAIINIIIFFTLTSIRNENKHYLFVNKDLTHIIENVINVMTYLIIIINFTSLIIWIKVKFPLNYKIENKRKELLNLQKDDINNNIQKENNFIFKRIKKNYLFLFIKRNLFFSLRIILKRIEIIVILWNLIFSSIALISNSYSIFYGVQLLIVCNISRTLNSTVKSIVIKYEQIFGIFLLVLIFLYIFSSLAFFVTNYDFIGITKSSDNIVYKENFCGSLFYCFSYICDYVLRYDTNLGEYNKDIIYSEEERYEDIIIRVLYHVFFFIIVVIILLALVFGIVIDAFDELRQKNNINDYDKENVCFICGATKEDIEKTKVSFSNHIDINHNIWNYVDYIISLKFEDPQETNAVNSNVIDMLNKNQIGLFPSFKSLNKENNMHNLNLNDIDINIIDDEQ